MANKEQCRYCKYVDVDETGAYCRRFPPLMSINQQNKFAYSFPLVQPNAWCGEFERRAKANSGD